MNVFGYISDMIAQGTVPAYLSLGIIAIFAFLVIWHSIRGYQRGVFKQIFHVVFVLVSVAVSYFVTAYLWSISLSILDGYTIESLLGLFGVTLPENVADAFNSFDMQVVEYIMLLPVGVIVMPFIFMTVFFVLNLVLKIFYVVIVGILHIPYPQSKLTEVLGFIVGMAEGVLVAFMILLPFADVSSISTEAYHMMEETREERGLEETDAEKLLVSYAVPLEQNPVIKLMNSLGGEALLDGFASFEDGNGGMNLRDEYASMLKLAFLDFASLHDADWMYLADHHKLAIDDIVDSIEDSRYKTEILSEVLSSIGHLVGAGSEQDSDPKSGIILALFSIFDGLESDELNDVLTVFKEFYYLLSDERILSSFETGDNDALVSLFTDIGADGKTTLQRMTDILNKSARTANLTTQITKLSISVLAGGKGMDIQADAKYESVKSSLETTLASIDTSKPKEEQVSDMSETIKSSLADNGMTIEPEVADDMAKYIIENHAGKTELNEADFNDALLYYYQAKKNYDSAVSPDTTPEGGTENGGTENEGTENEGTENEGTENGGTENGGTENSTQDNGDAQ